MKQFYTFLAAVLLTATSVAQVGIGTTSPDPSAVLDIVSTTGGLLVPRMTAVERDGITASQGLIIFCSDCASGEGELQVKLTSSWKNTIGGDVNDPPPPVVGDFYGGGVVFYILQDVDNGYVAGETHGLIAAVQDQSNGIQWGGSYSTTEATGTAIGTGSANTTTIINAEGQPATSYAAGLARAYTGGLYTDWFLPSKDELTKMYLNRATINTTASTNGGGNFSTNKYWGSSEVVSNSELGSNLAGILRFDDGGQSNATKVTPHNVRAVRAF